MAMRQRLSRSVLLAGAASLLTLSALLAAGTRTTSADTSASSDGVIHLGAAEIQVSNPVELPNPVPSGPPLPAALTSVTTVPYFTSSFSYNGTTYPYRMVGT